MRINAVLILFLCLVSLSTSAQPNKKVWKITSLNWQPYAGANMTNEGNSTQRLKRLLSMHGIELVVEFYPWKRAQKVAKQPGYLGYFPAWPEEVYKGFVASKPVDWSELGILKITGTKVNFDSIEGLFNSHTVGYVKTYTYPQRLNEAIAEHKTKAFGAMSEVILLKKLAAGRHDIAVTDPLVMTYLANQHGVAGVEVVKVLSKHPLVIALRDEPDNQENIKQLNKILAVLQKD